MKKSIATLAALVAMALACVFAAGSSAQGRFTGLDTTAGGEGTLRQARFGDERVTQMRVTLRRDGYAEIEIEGDMQRTTFTGRWSEAFTDSVNLNLNRTSSGSNFNASGKLYLRRGEFDRLDVEGRLNGERFALSFTARRGRPGGFPGSGNSGGSYPDSSPGGRNYSVELARREIEEQIFRERRERAQVTFDRADIYFVSNGEEGVRGTGRARVGNRDWEPFRFDSTVDTRQGRVTRVNYEFDSRSGPGSGYPPGGSTGSSGVLRDRRYEIQLVNTGRLLDVGRDGLTVQQTSERSLRSQQWDFEPTNDGYYHIRSVETGRVMTAEGDRNGASVVVAEQLRGRDNQLWEVKPGPDNGYYIVSKFGRALDSPSSARGEGGRMQLYSANGEANQRFRLRPIAYVPEPDYGNAGAGSVRWRGRVDDVVHLEVRGNRIAERRVSGSSFDNGRYTFTSPFPRREATLSLDRRKARGSVEIIERPSAYNNYTAIIEIRDPQGGAADYEFELRWN